MALNKGRYTAALMERVQKDLDSAIRDDSIEMLRENADITDVADFLKHGNRALNHVVKARNQVSTFVHGPREWDVDAERWVPSKS